MVLGHFENYFGKMTEPHIDYKFLSLFPSVYNQFLGYKLSLLSSV